MTSGESLPIPLQTLRSLSPLALLPNLWLTPNSTGNVFVIRVAIIRVTGRNWTPRVCVYWDKAWDTLPVQQCALLPPPVMQQGVLKCWCSLGLDCAQNTQLNGWTKDYHERHKYNNQRCVQSMYVYEFNLTLCFLLCQLILSLEVMINQN